VDTMTAVNSRLTPTGLSGEVVRVASRYWWYLFITGVAWLMFSIVVFRFDYTTVTAISILFGLVAFVSAANEILVSVVSSSGWRLFHVLLAVLFAATAVVAFIHPGDTFVALAAVMSFYFVFRGTFDVIASLMMKDVMQGWWLQLITGIAELLIGFWAAGSWGLSATVLVAWTGASAFLRGFSELAGAFRLREIGRVAHV
jgi:uncharacterized membrane protein HdeD (DUF308 family)